MSEKPTPGPWKIVGENIRNTKGEWIADHGGLSDDPDAALIVSAVNACFAVNRDNPIKVAEAWPEAIAWMREVVERGADCEEHWRSGQRILSAMEVKP
jgi:hypothetical protein